MTRPHKKVYARPPKNLLGKDPKDWTPEDEAEFDAFVNEFYRRLAEAAGRDPKTGKKKQIT